MIPVYSFTRVRSTNTKCTRGRGCNGHPAFPTPSLGERFIIGSGALRGEAANVCLMNASTPHSQSSSPAKEPVKDTDLILRSLRSKRLEGWTQRRDSRPSFETALARLLRMRSEIYSEPRKRRSSIPRRIGLAEGETRWRSMTIFARKRRSNPDSVIPGWSAGPDLRCAIAHRGISRFRVRCCASPRNDTV